MSVGEDLLAVWGPWMAAGHPLATAIVFGARLILSAFLIFHLFRFARGGFQSVSSARSGGRAALRDLDFKYTASQSRNVLYQHCEFCGFNTQWPSSGKITSFDGTP